MDKTMQIDPGFTTWPEDFAKKYREEGYWIGETFGEMLHRLAVEFGLKTAIKDAITQWNFETLNKKADQLAAGFFRMGLRAGDTAVVQLPNVPEFYAVLFGLIRLGVKPLLALAAHRSVEISAFCNHLQAKAYFFPDKFHGYDYKMLAQEMLHQCDSLKFAVVLGKSEAFIELSSLFDEAQKFPDADSADIALFLLSGGSTGTPKIIPRTHDDYLYSLRASAKICALTKEDIYFCVLPVAHNFALSSPGSIGALHQGATVVLCRDPSPKSAFELIEKTKATITALTPPLARLWLEAAPSQLLRSLRLLQVGGALFDSDAAALMASRMSCTLQQVFGMAEGLVCYTQINDTIERIVAAETLPISFFDEIKVVDDDDNEVPTGEVGSLLVRGPYTIRGYYRAQEINALAFNGEGFYRTGDLVRKTADGRLTVVGRTKDVVNRGGEMFSAEEIEAHLRSHPLIIDAAVFAEAHVRMGEISCAVVVARAALTPAEIRYYLRQRGLASFKIPDRIEFTDEFKKTAAAKIDKNYLRAKYRQPLHLNPEKIENVVT
jgi:2,3-dihydroxybenzoate-AMP ligase